jgi:hypothetical protein
MVIFPARRVVSITKLALLPGASRNSDVQVRAQVVTGRNEFQCKRTRSD